MSNRCWERRRTKQGLAARQFAAIRRAMRRDKDQPLPRTWISKGTGLTLTVTITPASSDSGLMDELWDEEPDFDHDYDNELGVDQARWAPPPLDPFYEHGSQR